MTSLDPQTPTLTADLEFLDSSGSTRLTSAGLKFVRDGEAQSIPLDRIRHVEREGDRVLLRWGVTTPDRDEHLSLKTGALSAGDRVDQIELYLEENLPGHLFSIADEDGIRYSQKLSCADLETAAGLQATTNRLAGMGMRDGVLRAKTDAHTLRVEGGEGFVVSLETAEASVVCGLRGNELIAGNGLSLGTARESESGGVTVALGDGTVLETLQSSGTLMRDGAVVGRIRRLTLTFASPQTELVGVCLLLGLIDGRYDQEDPVESRTWKNFYTCFAVGWVLSFLVDQFARYWIPPMMPLALAMIYFGYLTFRRRRVKQLAGPPAEDLAQRSKADRQRKWW